MKQFILFVLFSLASFHMLSAQDDLKITNKLFFTQGQDLDVTLQVQTTIAQQAMGQAIDFNVNATGDHVYKVTNSTEDNTTLHHKVNRIRFAFDGMGQKMNFDSREEKDLNGRFGKPVKDILDKQYDIIIDPTGSVLMSKPEKVELAQSDSRMAIITTMLKDIIDLVQPPKKGKACFFKVLPDTLVKKGDTWTESITDANGKTDAAYIVSGISDSTIIVDYVSSSVTVTKAEMMGNETTTTMNNKSSGKITLDRASGLLLEKTINTESNGTTEASFGTVPVTSKTTVVITVNKK